METEICVIGGGLAGFAAALAAARSGKTVYLAAPESSQADARTTALLARSITFLRSVGLGDLLDELGCPLRAIRIVDDTDRLLRAPELLFHASEIGLDHFGINVANALMVDRMREHAISAGVTIGSSPVTDFENIGSRCEVTMADATKVGAQLVLAADGRNSLIRTKLGVRVRNWSYPQTAIVLNFDHDRPHDHVSTEFHKPAGPFTTVPVGQSASALVWVDKPEVASRVSDLDPASLNRHLEEMMHSILGKVQASSPAHTFPISAMRAEALGKGRVALLGEAGHVLPPIGAQGFNLAIRDVEAAIDLITGPASTEPAQFGEQYHRARAADVWSRTSAVDWLNRSLISDFLPLQMARNLGLSAFGAIGPLRRFAMRKGVAPTS